MSGQTFQERSASFEHMYAPSRAKALFSKHSALKDILRRDVIRMRWEWKTYDTELTKEIQMFQKRSVVLHTKVREIEDKYFAGLSEDEDEESTRPSTRASLHRRHSDVGTLPPRPQTSYAPKSSLPDIPERPHSTSTRRSNRSNHSRPGSGLLNERKNQKEVRFTPRDIASAPTKETLSELNKPLSSRRRSSSSVKGRQLSDFKLTTAKKFELRNQKFKDDNDVFKRRLGESIEDFLDRIDKYKEEYRAMLNAERTKPPVTEADVTATEDVAGDSTMANKFQVKLRNPFGMYNVKNPRLDEASDTDVKDDTSQVAPLTTQNVAKLNNETEVTNKTSDTKSIAEVAASKDNIKNVPIYGHGGHDGISKPKAHTHLKQNQLRVDQRQLRAAFDDFVDGNKSLDDVRKMVGEAAKLKAKTKKARDRSIVPFMAAKRAAKTWKELTDQHRAIHAFMDSAPGDSDSVFRD